MPMHLTMYVNSILYSLLF